MSLVSTRTQSLVVCALLLATGALFLRSAAEPFGMPKATFLWLGALVLLVIEVSRWLVGDPAPVRSVRPFAVAVAGYLLAFAIATATSTSVALSVFGEYRYYGGLLTAASGVTVAWVVASRLRVGELERVSRWLLGSLAIVVAYGVMQALGVDPLEWSTEGVVGVFSTLGQPNYAAAYLGVTLPFAAAVALAPAGPRGRRGLAAVFFILGLGVAAATRSFQGVVGVSVGLLVVLVDRYVVDFRQRLADRVARRRVIELSAVAVLIIVIAASVPFVAREIQSGLSERLLMWRGAARMIAARPMLGFGPDTFGLHFFAFRPAIHAERYAYANPEVPHSVPVGMTTGGGIVLAVAYVAVVVVTATFVVSGLRRCVPGPRRDLMVAFSSMWLAYQVVSLVAIDAPSLAPLHWLSAGAVVALSIQPPEKKPLRARRHARRSSTSAPVVAVALIGLVAGWALTRPLRADMAATDAYELAQAGRGDEALSQIQRSTELAPYRAIYWLFESSIRQAGGDDAGARRALEHAAQLDAGNPQLALAAAQYAESMGDRDAAVEWRREAVRRDPRNPLTQASAAHRP